MIEYLTIQIVHIYNAEGIFLQYSVVILRQTLHNYRRNISSLLRQMTNEIIGMNIFRLYMVNEDKTYLLPMKYIGLPGCC